MNEAIASHLSAWESYYVIVGSSAAALTGLQFVVMTLIASSEARGGHQEISAFGTPTIVYFCAALLVSAVVSSPWSNLIAPAYVLAISGVLGVAYTLRAIRMQRRQRGYQPVLEDWVWHSILPTIGYASLAIAAIELPSHPAPALFVIAGVALLLIYIGIHNAWDTVTYLTLTPPSSAAGRASSASRSQPSAGSATSTPPAEPSTFGSAPPSGPAPTATAAAPRSESSATRGTGDQESS
jgi:hypothetical protein